MRKEQWKAIKGFEEYQISTSGQVKARSGKILAPNNNGFGYLHVHLMKDGAIHVKKIHRLVAEAFIDNPQAKPQVNHKDGNKSNNTVDNLEWATRSENMKHACANGLHFKRARAVVQIDITTHAIISTYKHANEAERATGINHTSIGMACKQNRRTGGYLWEYQDTLKVGI